MRKYNVALIPVRSPGQFIRYAEQLAKIAASDLYMLGEHSIPHVSLCHFLWKENHIDDIWMQIQALAMPPLHLRFKQHESKGFMANPKYADITWISLIPDQREVLKKWHLSVAEIIKTPLNASYDYYDPHLTLFNSRDAIACNKFNEHAEVYPILEDDFIIALGATDGVGQVTEILYPTR